MKISYAILIFTILFATSTFAQNSDQLLEKHFGKNDLANIHSMTIRFDNHILEKYGSSDIEAAYGKFFEAISNSKSVLEFKEAVGLSPEKKAGILNKLENETLSKIWKVDSNDKQNAIPGQINLKGEYLRFLQEMGNQNGLIKQYCDLIKIFGDVSPGNVSLFSQQQKELDLKDEKIKFIICVHYLSINYITFSKKTMH